MEQEDKTHGDAPEPVYGGDVAVSQRHSRSNPVQSGASCAPRGNRRANFTPRKSQRPSASLSGIAPDPIHETSTPQRHRDG